MQLNGLSDPLWPYRIKSSLAEKHVFQLGFSHMLGLLPIHLKPICGNSCKPETLLFQVTWRKLRDACMGFERKHFLSSEFFAFALKDDIEYEKISWPENLKICFFSALLLWNVTSPALQENHISSLKLWKIFVWGMPHVNSAHSTSLPRFSSLQVADGAAIHN